MPAENELTRCDFAALVQARSLSWVRWAPVRRSKFQTGTTAASDTAPLDLAEWSFFRWASKKPEIPRGTVINGKQMYVEQIPMETNNRQVFDTIRAWVEAQVPA